MFTSQNREGNIIEFLEIDSVQLLFLRIDMRHQDADRRRGLKTAANDIYVRGLPLITYAPRGRGGGKASYTFPLRITCKKGGGRGSR